MEVRASGNFTAPKAIIDPAFCQSARFFQFIPHAIAKADHNLRLG